MSDKHFEELYEKHGFEYAMQYADVNSEEMGEKCRWLQQTYSIKAGDKQNSVAVCTAYDRRAAECLEYNEERECRYGLSIWYLHKKNGYMIPNEINEIINRFYK